MSSHYLYILNIKIYGTFLYNEHIIINWEFYKPSSGHCMVEFRLRTRPNTQNGSLCDSASD